MRKWLIRTCCLLLLIGTHGATYYIARSGAPQEEEEDDWEVSEDAIYAGVAIPKKKLSGDEEQDWNMAMARLSPQSEFHRMARGKIFGFPRYKGFLFRESKRQEPDLVLH